jgi:hypothetical protein
MIRSEAKSENVMGVFPGSDPNLKKEYVVVVSPEPAAGGVQVWRVVFQAKSVELSWPHDWRVEHIGSKANAQLHSRRTCHTGRGSEVLRRIQTRDESEHPPYADGKEVPFLWAMAGRGADTRNVIRKVEVNIVWPHGEFMLT